MVFLRPHFRALFPIAPGFQNKSQLRRVRTDASEAGIYRVYRRCHHRRGNSCSDHSDNLLFATSYCITGNSRGCHFPLATHDLFTRRRVCLPSHCTQEKAAGISHGSSSDTIKLSYIHCCVFRDQSTSTTTATCIATNKPGLKHHKSNRIQSNLGLNRTQRLDDKRDMLIQVHS